MFVIILSPVGQLLQERPDSPFNIMVETEDVRAVRGGTGEAKCGGNYGAANRAGDRAIEKGFSQVLWLDGVERKYVEEGGGMNVMFKIAGKVVTPMLTGSILRRHHAPVLPSRCSRAGACPSRSVCSAWTSCLTPPTSGTLEEAWCVGTAAVISPIGEL